MCQPRFHHTGRSSTWRGYLHTTEICIGVPWHQQMHAGCAGCVADSGTWSSASCTGCVLLWCSPLRDVWHGLVAESNRHNQECNSTVTKYLHLSLSLSFFVSVSLCCFDAFPWEQWDRAGRCCCPWWRKNQTEQRGSCAGRFSVILCFARQSTLREFKARFHLCTHVTLYKQINAAHSYSEEYDNACSKAGL